MIFSPTVFVVRLDVLVNTHDMNSLGTETYTLEVKFIWMTVNCFGSTVLKQ